MLWARIFQGVATAPFEALTNACVGDLYFVHERGTRMAFTNVVLFGGAFLTPVFVGHIVTSMGWQWSFYFVAIFAAASFPLLFFFVPETAYRRDAHLNTDMELETFYPKSEERLGSAEERRAAASTISATDNPPAYRRDAHLNTDMELETFYPRSKERLGSAEERRAAASTISATANPPAKTSYTKTLSPFNGRKTDESFWKILIRPFPLFLHPAIVWACLIQGVIIGWTVFIGVVIAAVYLGPPLFFNEVQTGNLYTGAFIGAIFGLILSGVLSDWINKIM
jgi:MFS family permease